MALEGSIAELNLIDLFQMLSFNQKTGVLQIENSANEKANVYFENGSVVGMTRDGYHVGLALIKSGTLSKDVYEDILKKTGQNEEEIAKEIILRQLITEHDLRKLLRTRLEDMIYSLFEWSSGHFKFEETQNGPPSIFKFKIKTESLIMEGSRRIDEWSRLSSKIPSISMIPVLSDNTDKIDVLDMKPREWEILAMINGVNSIKDISDKFGNEFEIAKLLYGMMTLGIVKAEGGDEVKDVDYLERGKMFYEEGRYDKAIEELSNYLKSESSNYLVYRIIAASHFALGRFDRINAIAEEAAKAGINDVTVMKYNAAAYLRRGQIEAAVSQWSNVQAAVSADEQPKIGKLVGNLNESLSIIKEIVGGIGE